MGNTWDCVIVGGGAAGLSAGLVLGRARRKTLIVDAGQQSNLPAHGIGGLLGSDGRPPAGLYATGRAELAAYPNVEVRDGDVVAGVRHEDLFVLTLGDGVQVRARKVLLATGTDYERPARWRGLATSCRHEPTIQRLRRCFARGHLRRTGPRTVPGYHDIHTMASVLLAERAPADARVLVLGAGGGLEVKAFATAHPAWTFLAVDPAAPMLESLPPLHAPNAAMTASGSR